MSMESKEKKELDKDVSALQRDVFHLQQYFEEDRADRKRWEQSVETKLSNLSTTISNRLEAINQRTLADSKTPWQALAAWAGVLIIVGGMAITPIIDTVTELKEGTSQLREMDVESIEQRTRSATKLEMYRQETDSNVSTRFNELQMEVTKNKEISDLKT